MAISKKRLMATPATAYRDRVSQCVQAPGLFMKEDATGSSREDIMTDTNKRFAIVTDAKGIGVMRATEQPVTLEMAGRADPQRTTDFQAVLLAMAGHDLRGPLQIIQGYHDLLGTGVRTKSEQRLLQRGQHAIKHLNGLLDGILRNLVSNAIKYTEPNGRILIGCRRSGQNVRIDVCDTGIGIAGEQLSRIFEAFTRLDSTRCDGLGVGLFIVRRAIEVLGHGIDVSSVASRGSRFSIFATRTD